jgi:hypothetical protein
MSRPPAIHRPVSLHTTLPEDVYARLVTYLYSPAEGRVPQGAIQRFLIERINEFLSQRSSSNV